jgi:flavin-binding protein dodecin
LNQKTASVGIPFMSSRPKSRSELSGSSQKSIEGAIQTAISRAAKSLKNSRWCKPAAYRRRQVQHYEVFLKFGFTVEDAREE